MARETIIKLSDDIDGTEAVEEVSFALRGVEYEIDLNAKNVAALEKALDKFIGAGRKVSRTRSGRRPTTAASASAARRSSNVGEMREWATRNGFNVSTRGRIPAEVREAYEAAQG